jgi:hypothetical protein
MELPDNTVVCDSGSTYAEEPREFVWGGQRFVVDSLVARWHTPTGRAFRVACGPEQFQLFYDEAADRWSIEPITHSNRS